ncbi:iron ABC transporter permease [Gracilibacillus sp. YIM 98692]|uniref:FecCD family ABC transporter permease n=1 Tax=Gracilibacillus sp. YIM 98692 TaxID=2663532 RepID=UPI0013CF7AC8|nr:iron ABC transporter permease [Gracilibacillus sp. YIM 98692]
MKRHLFIFIILISLIVFTLILSVGIGDSSLSYNRLIPTLFGQGTFKETFVLYSIRLPRIIVTLLSGMALALSGAILQGITRNDLADPGIIGINAGAGVGVAVFYLFFPVKDNTFVYLLPLIAFVGALITASLIYLFSYDRAQGLQPVRLVLTGVGFSMALSGVMIILFSSVDPFKVDFIANWLAGNVWGTDWPFIWAILPWLVILVPFTLYKASQLDILGLGESIALGLGISIEKERILLLLAAVALAASAVAVTGGISFIGLMAPHIARALVGPKNQWLIPIAIFIGGWLLLLADTIGRNIVDPDGIPAGIMVALIGAPYFIFLLLRK